MLSRDARFYVTVALGVVTVSAFVLARRPPPGAAPRDVATPAESVRWCAEGLEPIAGGGCFAVPSHVTRGTTPLLVYLHGRYSTENVADELERQARVARMGTAQGYAVLALRGRKGQCSDPTYAEWWCWPSNERNAHAGPEHVTRWAPALEAVESRIGHGRRVLLGFSNGGYFAALIASRALAPFDAVAIAHAGPVMPMRPVGPTPPLLLITAEEDASDPEMQRLDLELRREGWPHVMVDREGGHALPEWDVQMALTFFQRTRVERLPLSPPLSTRPSRPRSIIAPDAPHASDVSDVPDASHAPEHPDARTPDVLSIPPSSWDAASTDPSPE